YQAAFDAAAACRDTHTKSRERSALLFSSRPTHQQSAEQHPGSAGSLCMVDADLLLGGPVLGLRLDRVPSLVAGCEPALAQTSRSASAQPSWTEAHDG